MSTRSHISEFFHPLQTYFTLHIPTFLARRIQYKSKTIHPIYTTNGYKTDRLNLIKYLPWEDCKLTCLFLEEIDKYQLQLQSILKSKSNLSTWNIYKQNQPDWRSVENASRLISRQQHTKSLNTNHQFTVLYQIKWYQSQESWRVASASFRVRLGGALSEKLYIRRWDRPPALRTFIHAKISVEFSA